MRSECSAFVWVGADSLLTAAVVHVREFGVRHLPAHASRIVRAIGWTVRKPIQRAIQRNEAAIQQLRDERRPALEAEGR